MFMDIVLHLYVYIIKIITQQKIQVLEWQKFWKTIKNTHNLWPPIVQGYILGALSSAIAGGSFTIPCLLYQMHSDIN